MYQTSTMYGGVPGYFSQLRIALKPLVEAAMMVDGVLYLIPGEGWDLG